MTKNVDARVHDREKDDPGFKILFENIEKLIAVLIGNMGSDRKINKCSWQAWIVSDFVRKLTAKKGSFVTG